MSFDWGVNYMSVDRIEVDDDGVREVKELCRIEQSFPESETFADVLNSQIVALFKAKMDTGVSSPCKAYSFLEDDPRTSERPTFQDKLLMADSMEDFLEGAARVREAVYENPMLRPGLLVVANIDLFLDEGKTVQAVFVTMMEFSSAMKVDEDLDITSVDRAVIRAPKQSLMYPVTTHDSQDMDLVKLNNSPASHPWGYLFRLRSPATTEQLLQREVSRALQELDPEGWEGEEGRQAYFVKVAPKKRSLMGAERTVRPKHRLEMPACAAVARHSSRTAMDLYGKQQPLKLSFSGGSASLKPEELGITFALAEHAGKKVLVVAVNEINVKQGALGAVDFLDPPSLSEALDALLEVPVE